MWTIAIYSSEMCSKGIRQDWRTHYSCKWCNDWFLSSRIQCHSRSQWLRQKLFVKNDYWYNRKLIYHRFLSFGKIDQFVICDRNVQTDSWPRLLRERKFNISDWLLSTRKYISELFDNNTASLYIWHGKYPLLLKNDNNNQFFISSKCF